MAITGNAQVQRIPNITTELVGVIARRLRPVIYKLNLVFALKQGTIASTNIQALAKFADSGCLRDIARTVPGKTQLREALRKTVTKVDSGNSGILHRSKRSVVGFHVHVISEESETKIGN